MIIDTKQLIFCILFSIFSLSFCYFLEFSALDLEFIEV